MAGVMQGVMLNVMPDIEGEEVLRTFVLELLQRAAISWRFRQWQYATCCLPHPPFHLFRSVSAAT